ncbi:hypothetical protein K2Y11_02095 [bacterium]|nr:hypothetical protein [bacterium]
MTQPHSPHDDSDSLHGPLVHARQFLARLESMAPPEGLTRGSSTLALRAKRLWEELVEIAEQMVEKEVSARGETDCSTQKEQPTLRFHSHDGASTPGSARPRFKRQGSMPSAASLLKSSRAIPAAPATPSPAKKVASKQPVTNSSPPSATPVIEAPKLVEAIPVPLEMSAEPVQQQPSAIPLQSNEPPIAELASEMSRAPVLMPAPSSPPKRVFAKKHSSPPNPNKVVATPPKAEMKPATPSREQSSWRRREPAVDPQPLELRVPLTKASSTQPDRSEIGIPIRWWSAPVFLAFSLMIAAVLGSLGAETLRVSAPQAELARVLRRPESTPDEVRQAARQLVSSPLTRYSATRDLLMAEATARVHDESNESVESNRLKHLERASAKEPLSDWHRLNFVNAAKADASRADDVASSWEILSKSRSAEPLLQEQLALHRVEKGELAEAVEQFKRMLEATPERTDGVVSQLLARNVSLKEAWNVVPNSPLALAKLYEMSERETVIGLRKEIEVRLTQLDPRASNSGVASWKPADWAALGTLSQGFERWDEAAHAWQQAVTMEPSRRDWMYSLARVRFEQKEFDECEETLTGLLMSRLSPDLLSQVKALQDQLTSARAEQAMPGGVPFTPATLRAN